jgi:Flp pilus assembly protein TadG
MSKIQISDSVLRASRLHRDEQGTISIVSVFAMLLLAMLLGMVLNVGRHIDGKIKMQNAADAAAYSGGVVLARGMNTLAFTNHLLADVFALTAFMREAQEQNASSFVPSVLAAWSEIGPVFASSGFEKFDRLGRAITQKVPLEQQMVTTYSQWASASSELMLPVLEDILAEEQIPEFQRALVQATPHLAQFATAEIARRHGLTSPDRGRMDGVLWRTNVDPVGGRSEEDLRTLPAVDPVLDMEIDQEEYFEVARRQRRQLAERYLADWNNESLRVFDLEAKMSQFGNLWRGFTCGQLNKLLEEDYPDTNLPHVIRRRTATEGNTNQYLEDHFMFVGVAYWPKLDEMLPGLFKNPIESDAQTFAQVMLFVPEPRLVKRWRSVESSGGGAGLGGVPGDIIDLPAEGESENSEPGREWYVVRQGRPRHWDLLNQNWTCQLVPATSGAIQAILESDPGLSSPYAQICDCITLPRSGSSGRVPVINTH